MDLLKIILTCVIGYLLGSLNSSLIIGKIYGVDVRKHGSGNAGATNTLRTLGKKAALFVTLGDVFKGIIACLLGYFLLGNDGLMSAGIGAIIGHNWPLYFKFKGGKGVL
ncbi:MAG: glycerol-3-phosphate acyltransferase, partial [Bacillota bacterium]|nr:glycerol-3-phosphate acyltransferase [Bacillota bacterium]